MNLMLCPVPTLERKFDKYMAEHGQRESLLNKLSDCATPENLVEWERQRQELERDRIGNPAVADKYFAEELTQGASYMYHH